jgi:hypothetical protein
MADTRNPFRIRTSEHIEFDSTFLRIFGPGALDLVPTNSPWDKIQVFQSAPGGGKTSLFRIFTPSALLTLYESRAGNEDYKDLYRRMRDMRVVSDAGVHLLGVYLSCARSYATLDDLNYDPIRKERLLYALLNARIIIAGLRGALALKKLNYPNDLDALQISAPFRDEFPPQLPISCSGSELFNWATSVEGAVCKILDSFGPSPFEALEGHDTLYALSLVRPEYIYFKDQPIASKTVVMFDDFHKLTEHQRKNVLNRLLDLRAPVGVWIAQRLEGLSQQDLFSGATTGREYDSPIELEQYWRDGGNSKKFETAVTNIANKRAKLAIDNQIIELKPFLQDSLDDTDWNTRYGNALEVIKPRVHEKAGISNRYEGWIRKAADTAGTLRERTIAWRVLEIQIDRDLHDRQLEFDWDLLSDQLPDKPDKSDVRSAAELLVSQEFSIPYYFGMTKLAKLASSNIEQFLAFSGDLYEDIVANALLRRPMRPAPLKPERQERILRKAINSRWQEIPRRIPEGQRVQRLLSAIGDFAQLEWKKGRGSYGAGGGITGIAIREMDRARLADPTTFIEHPEYTSLAHVLFAAISQNLIEAQIRRKQGSRGDLYMILYLNRWLCLKFGLPLQYGGWKPKSLDELCKWTTQGYKPSKEERGLLA